MAPKRNREKPSPDDSTERKKSKKKKKVVKTKKKLNLNEITVPIHNPYEPLSDVDEDNSNVEKTQPQKRFKVTPVVVTDVKKDIHKLIVDLGISCDLKITSVGKKIFPKSDDDKTKIVEMLSESKINFFTHASSENKVFKVILCGLPIVETSVIINSLTSSHKITPLKVIMFNTNAATKMYLCHFDKSAVNMKLLKGIKSVYHHIVTWQKFKPKDKGPTQCYQCTMYGHGISCCKRFAVCMLCSGNHLTKACTAITKETVNPTYKCFNCASAKLPHDHKANDVKCPFRAKYIETVEKARGKHTQKSIPKKIEVNPNSFPALSGGKFVRAHASPQLMNSFAEATAQSSSNSYSNHRNQRATTQMNQVANNDLWSFNEVAQLLLSSINELSKCKSKLDQLNVIANLLQHACT